MRISILVLLIFFLTETAQAKITIFACEAEWASLAREVVGKKAIVNMGSLPRDNPANVEVNTELLSLIRPADLIFCSGGWLEAKWLNSAIHRANNLATQANRESLFLVNGPATQDSVVAPRAHLNPYNVALVAAEFTRRVKLLDPPNADFYQTSYEKFLLKWQKSIVVWEKAALLLKGMRVVISDDSWLDLTKWLRLEVAAKIDLQNSDNTNKRLNDIVEKLKTNPAQAIIFANCEKKEPLIWLSNRTKTPMILLPFTVGGAANAYDLFSLYASTINVLLTNCSKFRCPHLAVAPEKK